MPHPASQSSSHFVMSSQVSVQSSSHVALQRLAESHWMSHGETSQASSHSSRPPQGHSPEGSQAGWMLHPPTTPTASPIPTTIPPKPFRDIRDMPLRDPLPHARTPNT